MINKVDQTKLLELEADLYTAYLEARKAGQVVNVEKVLLELPEDRRDEMREVLQIGEFMTDLFSSNSQLPPVAPVEEPRPTAVVEEKQGDRSSR